MTLLALPLALLLAAALQDPPASEGEAPAERYRPRVGLQSWTCRNLDFEGVVGFAEEHGLVDLQLISKHVGPDEPRESWARKKAVLEAKGLRCYTFGVCATSGERERDRRWFEMAKFFGCDLLVVEPERDEATWDVLEELAREYDVRLAIHNHGKGTRYGDPGAVKEVLAARDERIGVCLDVGWITAAGLDAAKVFRGYEGRVFDIHLKDKKIEEASGKTVLLDVEVGTGDARYTELFAALEAARWDGVLAIETDSGVFAKNPAEFVEAARAFVERAFAR